MKHTGSCKDSICPAFQKIWCRFSHQSRNGHTLAQIHPEMVCRERAQNTNHVVKGFKAIVLGPNDPRQVDLARNS